MRITLDDGAFMPTRAHGTDAGLDLYATDSKTIYGMKSHVPYDCANSAVFFTGVHVELPHGYYGKIESKSGLNLKHGVVSCGGVIDEGYTGGIVVVLYNFGPEDYHVKRGDKIAQLIIQPYAAPELELVESLEATERGDNGFGSTGR